MLNKRILTLVFVVAFLTLLAGCFPSAPPITENQAPIITSTPVTTAIVGVTYYYNAGATDPDGDTLTYSLIAKPSGMTIDSATGLISWVPTAKGSYAVIVQASDGSLSATQSFTIVVKKPYIPCPPPVNHAPEITSIPGDTAEVCGEEYVYVVEATDPDGDAVTYSLVSGPAGMTFDGTATISWLPTSLQIGANDVIVKASDGKSGKKEITQSFTITVADFPSIIIDGVLSLGEWDCATEIPTEGHERKISIGSMGTVRVLATVDYLYVSFEVLDSTDARLGQTSPERHINDEISINVNPTDGAEWGKPCDIIFKTGANPNVWTGISSGETDGWKTEWSIDGVQQLSLPGDLETMTLYDEVNRVTEWKIPLVSMDIAPGGFLKVGGSISIDLFGNLNYVYPIDLDPAWADASTYEDILVY